MPETKLIKKHNYICLLFDYYGKLLTKRRQEILHMSYEIDLSLSEIAERLDISRQAVHNNIQQAILQLEEYETVLGMVKKDRLILDNIDGIFNKYPDLQETELAREIENLKNNIL